MNAGTYGHDAADRRVRRLLAMLAAGVVMCIGMLLVPAHAMADEIDPEEYPPPPVEEEEVEPPEAAPPELARTGTSSSWPWLAAAGVGLLAVGSTLVVVRRRLTND